jgi:RHS repeat-associated protein
VHFTGHQLDNFRSWHRTLLEDKQDQSGFLFRRNRQYDPHAMRFTQEDPIGLAGGLNLYGYAGGDPVNFSDPFGLSPEAGGDCPDGYVAAGDTCYNQVAIIGMVVTGGGLRLFGAARSAAVGVSNA